MAAKHHKLSSGGSLPELVHDSCNLISVAINNQSTSVNDQMIGQGDTVTSCGQQEKQQSKGAVVGSMIVDKLHGLSEKIHQLSHHHRSGSDDHSMMSTSSIRTRAGTCK